MASSPSRNIMMLMAFTVAFSVIGWEVENIKASKNEGPAPSGITPGTAILGGTIAGVALIGLSHAGEASAEFAQGLAIVATATAVLVNGGPVWTLIGSLYGKSAPTMPTTGSTGTTGTSATTPTTTTIQTTPTLGG